LHIEVLYSIQGDIEAEFCIRSYLHHLRNTLRKEHRILIIRRRIVRVFIPLYDGSKRVIRCRVSLDPEIILLVNRLIILNIIVGGNIDSRVPNLQGSLIGRRSQHTITANLRQIERNRHHIVSPLHGEIVQVNLTLLGSSLLSDSFLQVDLVALLVESQDISGCVIRVSEHYDVEGASEEIVVVSSFAALAQVVGKCEEVECVAFI
jgi:hypothetical protein